MVVEWTDHAEVQLKKVFDYYLEVAGHKVATSLVSKIVNSSDMLEIMPLMAPVENYLTGRKFIYRSLVVSKMFKIIYFIDEKAECVVIATIWDCRGNPAKLQKEIPV